ncbi:hypothetical protein GCM10027416_09140 [Okibacterium endophyticum]
MTSDIPLPVTRTIGTVVTVWAVAIVGGVLAGIVASPDALFSWLAIVLAACVVLTFVLQLATHEKNGFILRVAASVTGAVVLIALISGVLALLAVLQQPV